MQNENTTNKTNSEAFLEAITPDFVCSCLKNHNILLSNYWSLRANIAEDISRLDDEMAALILPGKRDNMGIMSKGGVNDPVFMQMSRSQEARISERRANSMRQLIEIEKNIEVLNRVLELYHEFGLVFPIHYGVVNDHVYDGGVKFRELIVKYRRKYNTLVDMMARVYRLISVFARAGFNGDDTKIDSNSIENKLGSDFLMSLEKNEKKAKESDSDDNRD